MTDLALTTVSKRLTLVDRIGADGSNGDALSGVDVNLYPEGALFYVRASNRLYTLRKNLDPAVVATNAENVVDGIGSSATAGRFVAVDQWTTGTLSAGTVVLSGFDLTRGGFFQVTYVTPGGTQSFLRAAKTAVNQATVTSGSNADTSVVLVVFKESPLEI